MAGEFFSIYACEAGYYVCTDRNESNIMRALAKKDQSVNELAERFELKPASVSAAVKKLADASVLSSYTDPNDSRKTKYHSRAFGIMYTVDEPSDGSITRSIVRETFNEERSMNWILHRSLYSMWMDKGIDISPTYVSVGTYIGKKIADKSKKNDFINLIEHLSEFFSMFDLGDLTVSLTYYAKVEITGFVQENTPRYETFHDFCISIVKRAFEFCSMKWMYHVKNNDAPEGVLSFDLFFKEDSLDLSQNDIILPKMEKYDPSNRFAIYAIDGRAKLTNNPDWIDILTSLDDSPQSIKDLSMILNSNQSTISSNLKKLLAEGFIKPVSDKDSRKSVYALNGYMLFQSARPDRNVNAYQKEVMKKVIDGEIEYDFGILTLLFTTALIFGIDPISSFEKVGKYIGTKLAKDCEPNDFTDLFDILNNFFETRAHVEFSAQITFFVKVNIKREHVPNPSIDKAMTVLFENAILTAMKNNSGKDMFIKDNRTDENGQTFEVHFIH